jgi:putative peptidoglycan lipid II flippase
LLLAGLGGVSLLLTMGWQLSIAAFFGTSRELDAFWIALAPPKAVVDSFHFGVVTLVFILVFNLPEDGDSLNERWWLATTLLKLVLLSTALIVPLFLFLSPVLVRWMGPGLPPDLQVFSASMLRRLSLLLVPTALTGVMAGVLHAHQRFTPFAAGRAAGLGVQIVTVYLLARWAQVQALVWAMLLGAVAALILCLPGFLGVGFRYAPGKGTGSSRARTVLKLLAALTAFGLLERLNQASDRFFASLLGAGSVSALEFAWRFEIPVSQILSFSIALPSFALMAVQAAEKQFSDIRKTVVVSLRLLAILVIPLVGFLVVLREPLTVLWLERGAFAPEASAVVSSLIPPLGGIFVMRAFGTILVFGLMSTGRLKPILAILSLEVAANTFLNALVYDAWGLPGIVTATALAMVSANTWLWALFLKTLHRWSFRSLATALRKPIAVSLGSVALLQCATLAWVYTKGAPGITIVATLGGAFVLVHAWLCSAAGLIAIRTRGGFPRLHLTVAE